MKAIAYLSDTNIWKSFAGEKAEYAIGGPNIELFLNSYNKKYGTSYLTQATNTYGYSVGNGVIEKFSLTLSNKGDSLYTVPDDLKAYGYWLFSTTASDYNCLYHSSSNGSVYNLVYTVNYIGFRPTVCLKSDVKLQDNGNGTYTLK